MNKAISIMFVLSWGFLMLMVMFAHAENRTLDQVNRQNTYQWDQFRERLREQRQDYYDRRALETLREIERNTRIK